MKNILSIIVIVSLLFMSSSSASALSFVSSFGGRITQITYCTCSASILIQVGAPKGGSFIYQPGASKLYSHYNIYNSGTWVLGIASGQATCLVYSGMSCSSRGSGAIIRKIGTSRF